MQKGVLHAHISTPPFHRAPKQLPPDQDARPRGATPSYATFDKDYILGRQVLLLW